MFIFVGFIPNTGLVDAHVDHDKGGYYLTDPMTMMTNVPGIFAAGDVRSQLTRQITTAVGDATTATIAASKWVEERARGQRGRRAAGAARGRQRRRRLGGVSIVTRHGDGGETEPPLRRAGSPRTTSTPRPTARSTRPSARSAWPAPCCGDAARPQRILDLQRELFTVGAELATAAADRAKLEKHFATVTAAMVEALDARGRRARGAGAAAQGLRHPRRRPGGCGHRPRPHLRAPRRAPRRGLQRAGRLANAEVLRYLNRCSDLLFMLAREAEGDAARRQVGPAGCRSRRGPAGRRRHQPAGATPATATGAPAAGSRLAGAGGGELAATRKPSPSRQHPQRRGGVRLGAQRLAQRRCSSRRSPSTASASAATQPRAPAAISADASRSAGGSGIRGGDGPASSSWRSPTHSAATGQARASRRRRSAAQRADGCGGMNTWWPSPRRSTRMSVAGGGEGAARRRRDAARRSRSGPTSTASGGHPQGAAGGEVGDGRAAAARPGGARRSPAARQRAAAARGRRRGRGARRSSR